MIGAFANAQISFRSAARSGVNEILSWGATVVHEGIGTYRPAATYLGAAPPHANISIAQTSPKRARTNPYFVA